MSISKRTVFFVEWDAKFARMLKGVTLSHSLRGTVAIHIFYSPNKQEHVLPPYKPWILKHPVLALSREGLWKILESYALRFNFDTCYPLTEEKQSRSHGNGTTYYVLSPSQKRSDDLARKVYDKRGVQLGVITDGDSINLLDFLNFKCDICKIAFKEKGELRQHNQTVHGLTCLNINCRFSKKENAFKSAIDLRKHRESQLRCEFCPTKVFCASSLLDDHMRSTHKQCGCGCGNFFCSRAAYLDHFFSTYPSPKDIASVPRPSQTAMIDSRKSSGISRRTNRNVDVQIETSRSNSAESPLRENSFLAEEEPAIAGESTSDEGEEPLELNGLNEKSETRIHTSSHDDDVTN